MKKNIAIAAAIAIIAVLAFYSCNKVGKATPKKFVSYWADTSDHHMGMLRSKKTYPYRDPASEPAVGRIATLESLSMDTPPVKNQENLNSCVAWAVGYGMLSYEYMLIEGNADYNGEDRIFSPPYIYNQCNHGQDNGMAIPDALQWVRDQGCCTWSFMPGDMSSFTLQPTNEAIANASNYTLSSFCQMDAVDIDRMKRLLQKNYTLPIGVSIDAGFAHGTDESSFQTQADGRLVWNKIADRRIGNHAMLICGYDDAIHAFKALNSWGGTWGGPKNNGYAWIDYDFLSTVVVFDSDQGHPEIYWALMSVNHPFSGTTVQGPWFTFTANALPPYALSLSMINTTLNIALDQPDQNVVSASFNSDFAPMGMPPGSTFHADHSTGSAPPSPINNGAVTIVFPTGNFLGTFFPASGTITGTLTDTITFTDGNSGYTTYPVILSTPISLYKQ